MVLHGIIATSLRDEARLIGLVLAAGAVCTIDVDSAQLLEVQAAIDRGDVSVAGMSKTAPAPKKGK